MSTYRYLTKNTSKRGTSTVLYLPKEWNISPGDPLKILFWNAGDPMPDAPYKLPFVAKKMNSIGAIGIYLPKVFVEQFKDHDTISMCVITGDKDGNA